MGKISAEWKVAMVSMLVSSPVLATDIPVYEIEAANSSIIWTVMVNAAPLEGEFTGVSGAIAFDPKQLEESRIDAEILLESVGASYPDVSKELVKPEWFDVSSYPVATYTSENITHLENDIYKADGTLTLRGAAQPVSLTFTLDLLDKKQAKATATASLKRLDFGIGQGEWQETGVVENPVELRFVISAEQTPPLP